MSTCGSFCDPYCEKCKQITQEDLDYNKEKNLLIFCGECYLESLDIPQRQEYLDDCEKYGFEQSGTYNTFHWQALRNSSNPGFAAWRGYIDLPEDWEQPSQEVIDSVSGVTHGGITFGPEDLSSGRIGFDCGHYGDYTPSYPDGYSTTFSIMLKNMFNKEMPLNENKQLTSIISVDSSEIFRDFPYVKQTIFNMIDILASSKKILKLPIKQAK